MEESRPAPSRSCTPRAFDGKLVGRPLWARSWTDGLMLGIGTILNGAAILLGEWRAYAAPATGGGNPAAAEAVLCLLTCYVGLKTTVMSLGPGLPWLKTIVIALVAMTLGA